MSIEQLVSQKLQAMGGQQTNILRRYMYEILKDRYPRNEDIIDRIASALVTKQDLQDFAKLVNELYEVGYLKAVDDYRHLAGGREVRIVATKEPEAPPSIFNQKSPGSSAKE